MDFIKMQIKKTNRLIDRLKIAPKICHRLTCPIGRTHEALPIHRKWLSLGSSEQQPVFQSSLTGEKFLRRRNVPPRGPPRALTNIQSRRDFAFVRSSRLIRDILPTRLTSSLRSFVSFSFLFSSCLAVPVVLSLWNFPPAGKLLGSWLGRKSLKESRGVSRRGEKFPALSESKG